MQTYALIHLLGENRVLGTMVDELPEGTPLTENSKFILDGKAYVVRARWDDIRFLTSEDEAVGSVKLWSLIKLLAGSNEGAIAIANAIEPVGSRDYKLSVTVDESGTPVSVSVAGTGCLYCVTYVQAVLAPSLPSMSALAHHLQTED